MQSILLSFHAIVSSVFLAVGFILLFRVIRGLTTGRDYMLLDKSLSLVYLTLLYIQLFLGISLYFLRDARSEVEAGEGSFGFWVIQHFSVMIFTLILTQIGRIFIQHNLTSQKKFRNSLFYFGISYLIVLLSWGASMLR